LANAPRPEPHPPYPWLEAVYGAGHPYAVARGFDAAALDARRILDFRDQHFTPDNATLVIAGGFDPAVADAWVDYLFGSWTGHAAARQSPSAHVTAVSLARVTDADQVDLDIVMDA